VPYPDDFDDIVVCSKAELVTHPLRAQVALCMHKLEAEVNNGGFHQFFLNTSGELVPETLQALSEIGAPKTKHLLERAVAIAFPSGYPSDGSEVASKLADFDDVADQLEPLDAAFYRYEEPLSVLVNQFLEKPPNKSLERTREG
jgi:uncharacterized protein DUF4375